MTQEYTNAQLALIEQDIAARTANADAALKAALRRLTK